MGGHRDKVTMGSENLKERYERVKEFMDRFVVEREKRGWNEQIERISKQLEKMFPKKEETSFLENYIKPGN